MDSFGFPYASPGDRFRPRQDALLQQLSPDELREFAAAHAACAELLGSGTALRASQHGRRALRKWPGKLATKKGFENRAYSQL